MIIHLSGWPGSGKYTIGRLVAERLGARFVPNHVINAPGFAVDDFETAAFTEVVRGVRRLVFEQIVQAPVGATFVLTNVLVETEEDAALFQKTAALAETRQVPFLSVILDCEFEENVRRLVTAPRAARHSLTDVGILRELRQRYGLLRPALADRLDLDVTASTPEAVALLILSAVSHLDG